MTIKSYSAFDRLILCNRLPHEAFPSCDEVDHVRGEQGYENGSDQPVSMYNETGNGAGQDISSIKQGQIECPFSER